MLGRLCQFTLERGCAWGEQVRSSSDVLAAVKMAALGDEGDGLKCKTLGDGGVQEYLGRRDLSRS